MNGKGIRQTSKMIPKSIAKSIKHHCKKYARTNNAKNIEIIKSGAKKGANIREKSIKKRGLGNLKKKKRPTRGKARGTPEAAPSPQKTSCGALQKNSLREEQLQKVNLQKNKILDVA